MKSHIYKQALQTQIRKKFRGHSTLISKAAPRYAMNAERQYARLLVGIYRDIEKEVQKELPSLFRALDQAGRFRTDGDEFENHLKEAFRAIVDKMGSEIILHHIYEMLIQISSVNMKVVNRQWIEAVRKTLGIDLLEDYYNQDFYAAVIQEWLSENLDLIKTIPQDVIHGMEEEILDRYYTGSSAKEIAQDIRDTCRVSKGRARFIARDQTGKLQSRLTRYQQEDAGVEEYIWSANRDSKVRAQHRFLDGKKFRWDSPPISDRKSGRRCHPGEDYGCRCVALPVFSLNVSLPWERAEKQAEEYRVAAGISKEDDFRWKRWDQ